MTARRVGGHTGSTPAADMPEPMDLPTAAQRLTDPLHYGSCYTQDFLILTCSCTAAADVAEVLRLLEQARHMFAEVEAQNAKALALHMPHYEGLDGRRHDHTVIVYCADYARCDGNADIECSAAVDDGHELLACVECEGVGEDGEPTYKLWPCRTARALGGEPDA